ncbi:tetratricopeptide repeat protein [Bradyrhizobium sp. INPA01-394B]|uniref:Tetratricopeptide repeat protein n=1 Tax=Bradyrhizobium campsiandrae TaxID=1729892 RepID=A0ABR7UB68_9BRAD|nr:tetratricopeptide repeat protein [Bradyrhizobium campsiandrae]MBC9879517.1 tetratricopeptide repeat protein [Bradyrhizobium campsiandrae]MBC9981169.1 tetratricopeptide repeat protein [Bradyrhizobium campsiandrae]
MTSRSMVLPTSQAEAPDISSLLRAGRELYRSGEIKRAIAIFQAGLALAATASIGVVVDGVADLHAALANAFMLCDDIGSAAENYKAALRIAPHLVACWCNLGIVHQRSGRTQDAISLYLEALRRNPGHRPSRTNLVEALVASRQFAIARTLLLELLEETPEDAELRSQLGKVCFALGETAEAVIQFEQAVALAPGQAENFYWVGAIRQARGELEAAQAAYARAVHTHPVLRRPAAKSPPAFRALALFAPFVGNTPVEFLFKDCAYQTSIVSLLPGSPPDGSLLADEADVVVNLVSDADQGAEVLPLVAAIAASLGKPVVNDPARIRNTTRDATALALADVEGCRVPRTIRIAACEGLPGGLVLAFPVLARQAGMHGGDVFEKLADVAALTAFLAAHADHDRYVIDYVDYRSADGFFRKYRFLFIGEEILPYHLAIGGDWKLHRDATDMAHHAWMQEEEERFLSAPGQVFGASLDRALRVIRDRIGLDYFGIDCALDPDGRLVVFEVNASMLVHDQNPEFPYKDPYIRRIKVAFDRMLARLAQGN